MQGQSAGQRGRVPAGTQLPWLAVGDLNILYGYGDNGNSYWASR